MLGGLGAGPVCPSFGLARWASVTRPASRASQLLLTGGGPFDQFRRGLAVGLRRLRESLRHLFRALISMRNRRFVLIFAARLATGALTAAARRSMSSAMAA